MRNARVPGIYLAVSDSKMDSFFSVKYNPESEEDLLTKPSSLNKAHCGARINQLLSRKIMYIRLKRGVKVKVSGSDLQNFFSKRVQKYSMPQGVSSWPNAALK